VSTQLSLIKLPNYESTLSNTERSQVLSSQSKDCSRMLPKIAARPVLKYSRCFFVLGLLERIMRNYVYQVYVYTIEQLSAEQNEISCSNMSTK
jgi:hypothetical protein